MPIEQTEKGEGGWKTPLPAGTLGEEPISEPEVELSRLHEDAPDPGSEILPGMTGGPEMDGAETLTGPVCEVTETDWWTQTTASGVPIILADRMLYRQVVTLLSIGTAIQCEVGREANFLKRTAVFGADLPVELPVQPGEQLYLRQVTGIAQDVSGFTEQRGPGR